MISTVDLTDLAMRAEACPMTSLPRLPFDPRVTVRRPPPG